MSRLTDEQVAHWHEHGFVLVPDFLDQQQLAVARAAAHRYYPTDAEYRAAPQRYANLQEQHEFPFADTVLNHLATSPDYVDTARRLVGCDDVFLTQSLIWAKYAGRGNLDQPLHVDYANNTLLYPSDADGFRQMASILYLEDVTVDLGPTYVVSRTHTRAVPMARPFRHRADDAALYEHEQPVACAAGTILLYSMATFHRGSAFRATEGGRLTFHTVYRQAGCEWMGFQSIPRFGLGPDLKAFVERASVEQLSVIGVPPPGHAYWTPATLDGVASRYPGLDLSAYRAAVEARDAVGATA